jgi:hypothetical protein
MFNGQEGVPLKLSDSDYGNIDDSQARVFEGCGTKITYVIHVSSIDLS